MDIGELKMDPDDIKVETGKKRVFSTGAKKQAAEGKGMPSLVPGDAILDVAVHFEKGAVVHGARNWEKGIPLSVLLDSLERHLQQEKLGLTDEPHARSLAWNAIVYLATKLRIERGQLPANLDDMTACAVDAGTIPPLHIAEPCERCGGTGTRPGGQCDDKCPNCNGTGTQVKLDGRN